LTGFISHKKMSVSTKPATPLLSEFKNLCGKTTTAERNLLKPPDIHQNKVVELEGANGEGN
jgi:hypothetical protein